MDTFEDTLASARVEGRVPSIAAAVLHHHRVLWSGAVGTIDGRSGPTPTTDTQYRIGSITKTVTAVEVMRLRDEGLLDIGEAIGTYLPGLPFGQVTIAQLLTHTGGLQAETPGLWWERNPGVDWATLVAAEPRLVLTPGTRFHYSNLGYGILGRLVEALRRRPWIDVVTDEILLPLAMVRTTSRPRGAAAIGLAVHPTEDLLLREPEYDGGAMAPAGQLWATINDLSRWAQFAAGDTGDVLATSTLEEMQVAVAAPDVRGHSFGSAQGLGWHVDSEDDGRRFVGHGGSMPGFLANLWINPKSGDGVVVLANTTSGLPNVVDSLITALEEVYPPEAAGEPSSEAAPDVAPYLGDWFWGPAKLTITPTPDGFYLDDGRGRRCSRFVREGDAWRGLDSYYAGERLSLQPDGSLDLGSFVLTREPYPGGDWVS